MDRVPGRLGPFPGREMHGAILDEDREAWGEEPRHLPACVEGRNVEGAEVPPAGLTDRGLEQSAFDLHLRASRDRPSRRVEIRTYGEGLLRGPEFRGPDEGRPPHRGEHDAVGLVDSVEVQAE